MTSAHSDPATAQPPPAADILDDIFGSSPPPSSSIERDNDPDAEATAPAAAAEPSDLPSLRRQHVTTGYRDGISLSKGEHVQDGFDAGFPVGAQLGMRAGTVLGILEGVLRGYESKVGGGAVKKLPSTTRGGRSTDRAQGQVQGQGKVELEVEILRREQREKLLKIYQRTLKELEVQAVFNGLEDTGDKDQEKAEIQLGRKGDRVVSSWEGKVKVAEWERNMEALEMKKEEATAATATATPDDEGEQS
ncbi:Yae1 family protein [Aspergillus ruber CBS 135680]|uniref:Protein YAE1 n=1 Tax=Aspergillus ruber (strain CBS 135680) TaxID=1388766 RepID=A0A017SGK5_ASPRC|nr:uncharacterized protein EURHEDRAFT_376623 [Aspergillus ruber CBS 135680]EYE96093.1 hypothetical protein EURHEDRAFT_376623 [Aspergillus ruber CBS 135680]